MKVFKFSLHKGRIIATTIWNFLHLTGSKNNSLCENYSGNTVSCKAVTKCVLKVLPKNSQNTAQMFWAIYPIGQYLLGVHIPWCKPKKIAIS